jgi:hypothetical protein
MATYTAPTTGNKRSKKSIQARAYQRHAADMAISNNCIINIRTGGGKTLIAVLAIDHFLQNEKGKRILFIVPSRALVAQQAEYVRIHSTASSSASLRVAEMCGNDLGAWTRTQWENALRNFEIFVGTAEVFRMALVDQGFIKPKHFSLVIIDECHNATGNSPMASCLRDSIQCAPELQRPRVVGLTASFVNGSMKDILKKRASLEALFNGNVICPVLDADAINAIGDKEYLQVHAPFEDLGGYERYVRPVIESVLRPVARDLGADFTKWVKRGMTVFQELGFVGLRFWLKEGILTQLKAHCDEMKKRSSDLICMRKAARLEASFPSIHSVLRHATVSISIPSSGPPPPPAYSLKLTSLLRLLDSLLGSEVPQRNRGIIFVEQVSLTYPLAVILNRYFMLLKKHRIVASGNKDCGDISCPLEVMGCEDFQSADIDPDTARPVSGANSMLDRVRDENLDLFRSGAVPLLVATNALEEGIDVPECEFVVRFDSFSTTKSHIQGSGRARLPKAKIYYFENDPSVECSKADTMEDIGRSDFLNLSQSDLQESLREMQMYSTMGSYAPIAYPFQHKTDASAAFSDSRSCASLSSSLSGKSEVVYKSDGAGEVNFFNCLLIFYKYVQRTLKQSVDPESLFQWKEEMVRQYPFENRQVLVSIKYPTPTGYHQMLREEVDSFWGPYRIEDVVLPRERYSKMTVRDRDTSRAVYVLVVKLHTLDLLTPSNDPSPEALQHTKYACKALPLPDKLCLKNRFASNLLASSKTSPAIALPVTFGSVPGPAVVSSSNTIDYKSTLQRHVQRLNRNSPPQSLIAYETNVQASGDFSTVVSVGDQRFVVQKAYGQSCKKKKDAEQSAAKELLRLNNLCIS